MISDTTQALEGHEKKMAQLASYQKEYFEGYSPLLASELGMGKWGNYQAFITHLGQVIEKQADQIFNLRCQLAAQKPPLKLLIEKKKKLIERQNQHKHSMRLEKEHMQQKFLDRNNDDRRTFKT